MRIGIDARFFGGEQSKGLGRYTQKLIEYLAEHDQENEYVIFLQPESLPQWHIKNTNFTVVEAPYHWYSIAEQIFMPWKIFRAKVDFMHFPHFNVPLLYRAPFIATIHDLIIIHFPTERATTLGPLLYKFKHWAGSRVMQHAVKRSQHIITVSEFSKRDISEYYKIDPSKITVTYEAAEHTTRSKPNDNSIAILKKYGIKSLYVLYVGNAYPHKNLEVLLQVMKQLQDRETDPSFRLVLVGKEDYFYSRLKQEAWAMNIDDRVIFTDFVPDEELASLYSEALAYIFPSRYEGFGLPPLEAMHYGTPVLAANTSCLPEILGDAAIYFDPNDISGIIKSIQQVIDEPATRQNLIERGLIQADRYSWKRMMKQTIAVYQTYGKTPKQ
ncbi:MAG: hypothetical protein COW24_01315 [Candidatus Kerfeldbacteria bacterium CG15_BIG_FIL_POST_REV_8_21_14_020_45_12]|uniref:Glycosyltransferase family 1 protein n=1 Tax=Candidatus Kerfeldbacteria bacterium CG15_BIG_FIL_POST_REV_8_21_14_020_45_12 TaxID=2014247 RepID=A0A2M7H4S6_9BACT|nr:MAG: hypothetical protein COW24_01315 [Candidatus Kerfeldbacteria bacterium CG15_BIG_FIL_POST_REV_8_21_14_020_45_12]PJA93570.1 MAG: hypothetical protein CO132_02430 [Candidatus Kerfeldbacteria bacterium CG_4_9_14_3_um_filter_45_8]